MDRRPLRVLVAPHHSEIGGSQINALELAGALNRRDGIEVSLYLPDGPLVDRARSLDIPLHLTSLRESAPSPGRIVELHRLARRTYADLVHAYEWAPTIDAAYGVAWGRGVPVLSTILSMDYPYFLPRTVPVVMGTRALHAQAHGEGRRAFMIEPPVDTDEFAAGAVDPAAVAAARAACGAGDGELLIVVVGRLAARLKLDGLLALVAATGVLAAELPVRLGIVGDGPERSTLERAAAEVNARAGSEIVRLLGSSPDPRPWYRAADVVVGMGSSALRAMALERVVVVQGENGFWALADGDSAVRFTQEGWFGVGAGEDSVAACVTELRRAIGMTPDERRSSELFGRRLVERLYSLDGAAEELERIYLEVARSGPSPRERLTATVAQSVELAKFRTVRRLQRLGLRRVPVST